MVSLAQANLQLANIEISISKNFPVCDSVPLGLDNWTQIRATVAFKTFWAEYVKYEDVLEQFNIELGHAGANNNVDEMVEYIK
jgi:hypothetical protein